LASLHVPEFRRAVLGSRGKDAAVWAKGKPAESSPVPSEKPRRLVGLQVVNLNGVVGSFRRESVAIRVKGDPAIEFTAFARAAIDDPPEPTCGRVVEADVAI
jgi:hypothetical protein